MTPFTAAVEGGARRDYRPLAANLSLIAADFLAMVTAAAVAAIFVRLDRNGIAMVTHPAGLATPLDLEVLFAAMIVCFALRQRYTERTPFWTETRFVVGVSLCACAVELMLGVFANDPPGMGRGLMALLGFAVLAPVANRLVKQWLMTIGCWTLPVLVVGDGPSAAEAEVALGSDQSLGYRFVGRVNPATLMSEPGMQPLWALLGRHGAKRLLIALGEDGVTQRQITESALRERVPFSVVPAPHAFPAFACEATCVLSHNTTFLSFREGLSRPTSRLGKAAFDIAVAAVALLLLSPLLLALAILCRLDGGPALFAQWRVGARGRPFRCLKFRTMVVEADRVLHEALAREPALAVEWAATRKLVHDPRTTRSGRFLRRTSLDELPQLFNVLRLDMSLVGPRPIVDSEVPLYGEHIAQYYATRPGLTGLWQVSGRNDTSYERRVQLDVWYVNNWSIWHDVAVLLKTLPAVLGRRGAY